MFKTLCLSLFQSNLLAKLKFTQASLPTSTFLKERLWTNSPWFQIQSIISSSKQKHITNKNKELLLMLLNVILTVIKATSFTPGWSFWQVKRHIQLKLSQGLLRIQTPWHQAKFYLKTEREKTLFLKLPVAEKIFWCQLRKWWNSVLAKSRTSNSLFILLTASLVRFLYTYLSEIVISMLWNALKSS